jgi:hypothetical protein
VEYEGETPQGSCQKFRADAGGTGLRLPVAVAHNQLYQGRLLLHGSANDSCPCFSITAVTLTSREPQDPACGALSSAAPVFKSPKALLQKTLSASEKRKDSWRHQRQPVRNIYRCFAQSLPCGMHARVPPLQKRS